MSRAHCWTAIGALALACGAGPEPDAAPGEAPVVAFVDGEAIRADELDAPLRIELYELDSVAYALRAKRLDALIAAREADRVERRLTPPVPPRFEIDVAGAPLRGRADAPVTIVQFVDYESPHARRTHPVLTSVLDAHPDEVRFALRDLPLPFHRHAVEAARAAHCAGEQDAYWRMHDALLLEERDLPRERLEAAARRAGLELAAWRECLDSRRHADRVAAGALQAAALGVGTRMAVFVGGRYLSPPISRQTLTDAIAAELGRPLAVAADAGAAREAAPAPAPPAELPWSLDLVIPARGGAGAFAAIRTAPARAPELYAEGDRIDGSVELVRIFPDRVELERDGAIETLVLNPSPAPLPPGPLPRVPAGALPAPDRVATLQRARVDAALADRRALERALAPAGSRDSERRLLAADRVEPGGLLDAVGIESGDVLLTVDGVFATGRDAVWRAFAERDDFVVVSMRRGRPQAVRVRIE